MSTDGAGRVLVPVGESVTMRQTTAHVVSAALDGVTARERPSLHFVFPAAWLGDEPDTDERGASEMLDRVRSWVREDLDVEPDADGADSTGLPVEITTAVIGTDEYLFSPRDYADLLLEYARANDIGHIVLDPEFRPGASALLLTPLEAELSHASDVTYEEAPVEREVRGRGLLGRASGPGTFLTIFGLSFLFYQIIGGFHGLFDFVTGAVSAGIVAAVLSGITFDRAIRPGRALRSLARWGLFVPYLLWEVTKANFEVAYIVLHPSLPIDPSMERIRPAVPLGLPVMTLANSITLTPGTVTVDVRKREFYVHALTDSSREALYGGALERAVRFVFFGRRAARSEVAQRRGRDDTGGTGGDRR